MFVVVLVCYFVFTWLVLFVVVMDVFIVDLLVWLLLWFIVWLFVVLIVCLHVCVGWMFVCVVGVGLLGASCFGYYLLGLWFDL